MPSILTQSTISSLHDFSHALQARNPTCQRPLWFRGCGDARHALLPSLFRHPTITDIADLFSLEQALLSRFRQRSVPFHERPVDDDWECLFFMQHYGVPTRLLDWTENPYVGLYFALTSARRDTSGSHSQDAALWVLDPHEWNKKALVHLSYDKGPLSRPAKELDGYAPNSDIGLINIDPVALLGTHNSRRIVAQRGVFTIFGKGAMPMEQAYSSGDYPSSALHKLVIPATSIDSLLHGLIAIGITDSTVFPDLDGLAKEIRRHFGYLP